MKLLLLLTVVILMTSCAAYHHGGEYYEDSRYGYNPYGGYRQTYPSFIGRFGVYRGGAYGDDHRSDYHGDHEHREQFRNDGGYEGRGNHWGRRGFRGERREGHGDRD